MSVSLWILQQVFRAVFGPVINTSTQEHLAVVTASSMGTKLDIRGLGGSNL